jgi:hypothetical protein
MTLADEFQSAVAGLFQSGKMGPTLLPLVLAQACVGVLPVSGAGLSMTDHLRVPLAASDADAAIAERLQTTLGEGPCLSAVNSDDYLMADADTMARRWPTFSEGFLVQTPYRSVASLPLRTVDGVRLGALDLYSVQPQPLSRDLMEDVDRSIATPISSMLFRQSPANDMGDATAPSWLATDAANERMNVWVGVGMLMAALRLSNSDALAVLRGYAFSHEQTLDEIARELTDKRLEPDQLLV